MGKDERLSFRLDSNARKKLAKACEVTGLDEPSALRACLQAFIEHVEEHGGIWLPLAIVPKSEIGKSFSGAGEKPTADAGGPSSPSTRSPANYLSLPSGDLRLNEDSPADQPRQKTSGPRSRSTRGGIEKTVGRKTGKASS